MIVGMSCVRCALAHRTQDPTGVCGGATPLRGVPEVREHIHVVCRILSVPLQSFRADIDFKRERATLSYGVVGIKVWIYRGKIFADKKNAKNAYSAAPESN